MLVKTFLVAFQNGAQRDVFVPEEDWEKASAPGRANQVLEDQLDLVFYYGQNDFQPVKDRCSLSMGDYILHPNGNFYLVKAVGFEEVPGEDAKKSIGEAVLAPAPGEPGYEERSMRIFTETLRKA